jgi:glutathione S-transferase
MVPILCDDDRVIHDSWNIACYLEDRFPDRPSLFGGEAGRGLARLVNNWAADMLGPAIRRLIYADFIFCLAPEDREYFCHSREAAFGCTLEEHCADRPRWLGEFAAVTAPLEATLREQPYFGGATANTLIICCFRCSNTPDSAVPTNSSPRTPPCAAGVTAWPWRSTGWATAIRGIRRASPDAIGRPSVALSGAVVPGCPDSGLAPLNFHSSSGSAGDHAIR